MTQQPVLLSGALRGYDWGAVDGLARWTGDHAGRPHAELWFGAHPAAPSPVRSAPDTTLLDTWPDAAPIPLLVKLLCAGTPLSLQVHPRAELVHAWRHDPAAAGLLADAVEKTELLIAVEPFLVLAGWRAPAAAAAVLAAVAAAPAVIAAVRGGDFATAVGHLLGADPVHAHAERWLTAAAPLGPDAVAALRAVTDRFPGDPGIAVAALLDSRRLAPGDAVYVPAGVPHAYVHGLGVEVMTSSDNVLRLGLTTKTVSVEHAVAALDPTRRPLFLTADAAGRYHPDTAPFAVTVVRAGRDGHAPRGRYRVVLPIDGSADVATGTRHHVPTGCALAVPATAPGATVTATGAAMLIEEFLS